MSRPLNKKDRFEKGEQKAIKRVIDLLIEKNKSKSSASNYNENLEKTKKMSRHTTTLCSCPMCGNPRKFFKEKTLQEKKINERDKDGHSFNI